MCSGNPQITQISTDYFKENLRNLWRTNGLPWRSIPLCHSKFGVRQLPVLHISMQDGGAQRGLLSLPFLASLFGRCRDQPLMFRPRDIAMQ